MCMGVLPVYHVYVYVYHVMECPQLSMGGSEGLSLVQSFDRSVFSRQFSWALLLPGFCSSETDSQPSLLLKYFGEGEAW